MATSTIKGTKIDQLLYVTSADIGTVWKTYSCNWQDYDLLIFTARFYSNEMGSMVTTKSYFASTRSGTVVSVYDPSSEYFYQAYQNGEGSIYLAASGTDNNRRLIIYGIKFN